MICSNESGGRYGNIFHTIPNWRHATFMFSVSSKKISLDYNIEMMRRSKQLSSCCYITLKEISMHPESKNWLSVQRNDWNFSGVMWKNKITLYGVIAMLLSYRLFNKWPQYGGATYFLICHRTCWFQVFTNRNVS